MRTYYSLVHHTTCFDLTNQAGEKREKQSSQSMKEMLWWKGKSSKRVRRKRKSVRKNYIHLKKGVFLIQNNDLLILAPAKKAKFEKLGSFYINSNHSRKKLKQHTESFLNLDNCINANYYYESLCSHLVSQPKSNKIIKMLYPLCRRIYFQSLLVNYFPKIKPFTK